MAKKNSIFGYDEGIARYFMKGENSIYGSDEEIVNYFKKGKSIDNLSWNYNSSEEEITQLLKEKLFKNTCCRLAWKSPFTGKVGKTRKIKDLQSLISVKDAIKERNPKLDLFIVTEKSSITCKQASYYKAIKSILIEDKLTPDQLKQFKKDYLSGELSQRYLSKKYGLLERTIKDFTMRNGLPSPHEVRERIIEDVNEEYDNGASIDDIAEKFELNVKTVKYFIALNQ